MTVTDNQGNPVAIADLNAGDVGAVLMMLVPGCLLADHESIRSTFDYMHPEPGSAGQFVKDLFTMDPRRVAQKWYGSEWFAKTMAAEAIGKALFEDSDVGDVGEPAA